MKIRAKIMLWYTLLSAMLLGMLLPAVYTAVAASLRRTLYADLQMTVLQAFSYVEAQDGQMVLDVEEMDLKDGVYLYVTAASKERLYESVRAPALTADELVAGSGSVSLDGESWAVQTQEFEQNEDRIIISAVSSMSYVEESLRELVVLLLLAAPIYLVISALGAFLLAKRVLRPISRITQAARVIGGGDMSARITGVSTEDEVGELAATFNGMLDKLELSFKRERQFTSDASHELRTPITVISACAEDALTDGGSFPQEDLETIKNEAQRMTKIISQLLMLSRGYEGRWHFEPDRISLCDMVASVAEELCSAADERHIHIHNDIDRSLELTADQSLMTQLFVNLIGNAVKYGSDGGNVWLSAREQPSEIEISVADDGIGISPEDQAHIFERFYRADKARDRSGTGLGLAIVKWIAELHGGAVSVKSELGSGTKFVILIPKYMDSSSLF